MNGYSASMIIDALARQLVEPFIRDAAVGGQFVINDKGPLAREIQETIGDYFFNTDGNRLWPAELKAESENKNGNLFLESWSNRNLEDKDDHLARGSNPGWFLKLRAEILLYVFLNGADPKTDCQFAAEMFIYDLFKLKRFMFRHEKGGAPRCQEYLQKPQGKYDQKNDTWGWCVAISDLGRDQGFVAKYEQINGAWQKTLPPASVAAE